MAAEPTDLDAYRAILAQRQALLGGQGISLVGGGDGPHDPGMETRVASLEADAKDVKGSLQALQISAARIETTINTLATKADISTLGGRIDVLDARLKKTEETVGTSLNTAMGKAIGAWQFLGILAGSVTIIVAGVSLVGWLVTRPWFPH